MIMLTWHYDAAMPQTLAVFLKQHGFSRNFLKKIKYHGGALLVNQQPVTVRALLQVNDQIQVKLPPEQPLARIEPAAPQLQICFEDDHFLVVDKPALVAAMPSHVYKTDTMANRVKGYLMAEHAPSQVIHIVTRLDRGTSGVMLFAKHGYAHSLLSQQLQNGQLQKQYLAFVQGHLPLQHQQIDFPIGRLPGSFIQRTTCASGRAALTEYWQQACYPQATCVRVALHTGRTHQIRVHFSAIGHPLLGDTLYGGPKISGLKRPALHCQQVRFFHPFRQEMITIQSPLPSALVSLAKQLPTLTSL